MGVWIFVTEYDEALEKKNEEKNNNENLSPKFAKPLHSSESDQEPNPQDDSSEGPNEQSQVTIDVLQ